MKLLVCISKTPDTTAKVAFISDGSAFDNSGVAYIMNPYDEWYALVRALELKEQYGGSVTAINVGGADNDVIIRKALAIGADDSVRIDAEPRDAHFTATQIAAYARDKGYDAIFAGKETIDYNGSLTGSMIAEILELPFLSYVSHLTVEDGKVFASCDIEGGVMVCEASLPVVVSAAKGIAEQRIPNMRGIMMSKSKPLQVIAAVDVPALTSGVHYTLPRQKSAVRMVDAKAMDELVKFLHEEAKVI